MPNCNTKFRCWTIIFGVIIANEQVKTAKNVAQNQV
jgi:hypothetical protein